MVQKCCLFLMNWNTSNFLGFDFWLQGTHIDASGPFSSKLRTLTQTEGLWTFSSNLALCVPPHCATPIVFNFFYPIKLRLTLRPSPSLPSSCLLTTQKKSLPPFSFITNRAWYHMMKHGVPFPVLFFFLQNFLKKYLWLVRMLLGAQSCVNRLNCHYFSPHNKQPLNQP